LYELIAICWESGQKSAIHNHRDQSCWMATAYGKVQVHNFKLIRKDPSTGYCELESSGQFLIEPDSPQEVDPEEPIHQVLNLPSFGSRAVTYEGVRLSNTSEFGVLKMDLQVEKVHL
jgi:hypothetical protein